MRVLGLTASTSIIVSLLMRQTGAFADVMTAKVFVSKRKVGVDFPSTLCCVAAGNSYSAAAPGFHKLAQSDVFRRKKRKLESNT